MTDFFTKEEEQQIIKAIREAELNTSGEIRVHLESHAQAKPLVKAVEVFERLGMHKTKARNGVLIYIAPDRKEFAILGDKGINDVVPKDFWNTERDILLAHFKRQEYTEGVCIVIQQIGEKLKAFFPYQSDDKNELPDEISYG